MPNINDDFFFNAGVDYSVAFAGYATALTQGDQISYPNDLRGMVYYNETQPPTVGGIPGFPNYYVANKRGMWVTPSNGNTYSWSNAAGAFVNIATRIPANTITTAMLIDKSVTLPKIAVDVAAIAGDVLTVTGISPNQTLIYQSPTANIPANSLSPSKITTGTNGQVLWSNGASTQWHTLTGTELNGIFTVGPKLTIANIAQGAATFVLRTNAAGTSTEWVDATSLVQDNSVAITKLSPGAGNANKYIGVNSAGTGMVYITPPVPPVASINFTSAPIAFPGAGATITLPHALGVIPRDVYWVAVCNVVDATGFPVGREVDLRSFYNSDGSEHESTMATSADATNVYLQRPAGFTAVYVSQLVNVTTTSWSVKCYANT